MEKFIIRGGKILEGKVDVSGAKNSALALMPATLLNDGINAIENTPEVNDIHTMIKLMTELGSNINFDKHRLTIDNSNVNNQVAPYELVKKMRASIYVLGPLLTRFGYAKVSMPGGCAWGPRPINLHLEAMKKLGAEIELELGYIIAKSKRLRGAKIHFDVPSVGATGNTLMAAALAKGSTLISNAATEPEIVSLAEYLTKMGAKINGIGTKMIEIEGVDTLSPADYYNIPDRIEAGTLLIAAGITGGNVTLCNVMPNHVDTILIKLEEAGFRLESNENEITLRSTGAIANVDVTTDVYPGFPTDMQAQWIALMSLANGTSTITDTIYPDRFNHVPELARLGANIEVVNNSAVVKGVGKLTGAKVMSTDLRASASLVLAGLAASGTTEILRIYHIDRGYQRIEEKLKTLGADIERVKTDEY
ncbi:UDP-N-acetylglucosamine 1-carboxyvinyltransferase [Melioribacter roseus P3M-2]|uniref:UDP-N-acetylglucosamine 1-carboxyvinyltransferase n=1 Tax=Melioribacter roseus (strain DSM 23840 / JCM 17771 / VKM B-2668 / P3M-2) TaxID=1191523 RepID=I6YY89_MELRP|nr:UDP-N-acetylglucosamine 1-carboxyvinyltransferase [Melioribacter roseus]AFN75507.1 UDP-N-acetylglucosamine 1-carboxyvinyltransferase [Melioribacter roseus P3M-2]